jgi:hypothetical protein
MSSLGGKRKKERKKESKKEKKKKKKGVRFISSALQSKDLA